MNEIKICLFLMFLSGYFLAGSCQCEIENLRLYRRSIFTNSDIHWDCDQPNTIFIVTHQLVNAGMCDERNDTEIYTIEDITTNRIYLYQAFNSQRPMIANSTYLFNVQAIAKIWEAGTGYIYGPPHHAGYTLNTVEDVEFYSGLASTSYNSFEIAWRHIYPDCANPEIEYQLYRDHDGKLVDSNSTAATGTRFTLTNLECDTRYRVYYVYRTNAGVVEDRWYTDNSVKTRTVGISNPSPEIVGVSTNGLNVTWNEYQNCNNHTAVTIVYEYQLARSSPYQLIYSGQESNTDINFDDLKSETQYRYRMRVLVTSVSGSTQYSGWSSEIYATTLVSEMPEVCEILNMQINDNTDSIQLDWDCDEPDAQFEMTYQLVNAGMCDTGSDVPPTRLSDQRSSYYSISKRNLPFANSTYTFTVQSKQWKPVSGTVYGPAYEVNVTSDEENCEIRDFRVEDDGDYISLFWNQGLGCQKPEDELYVTYRLFKSTTCDSGNESNFPSFQLPLKSLTIDDRRQYNLKFSKADDLTLYANSTYEFTVQIIEWRPWTGYVYTLDWLQPRNYMSGSRQQAYLKTNEGINFFDQSVTEDSFLLSWSPYLDCADANYEYKLYKDIDGNLVTHSTTSEAGLIIFGLECGTRYRLLVSYRTKNGAGGEEWLSFKTKQSQPLVIKIKLTGVSETTLSFTWDEFQNCNQEITRAEYKYELLRADNRKVYQGSSTSTFISFDHLEPNTSYNLRVRLTTFEVAKASFRFSNWNSIHATTV